MPTATAPASLAPPSPGPASPLPPAVFDGPASRSWEKPTKKGPYMSNFQFLPDVCPKSATSLSRRCIVCQLRTNLERELRLRGLGHICLGLHRSFCGSSARPYSPRFKAALGAWWSCLRYQDIVPLAFAVPTYAYNLSCPIYSSELRSEVLLCSSCTNQGMQVNFDGFLCL